MFLSNFPRTAKSDGFTLIEIIIVLVLLGILAATAVPKYMDLMDESHKKAAASSAAEAQSRMINAFGQALLQGKSCQEASEFVADLGNLADTAGGSDFGGYLLYPATEKILVSGTALTAAKNSNDTPFAIDPKLYLPTCESVASVNEYLAQSSVSSLLERLIAGTQHSSGIAESDRTEMLPNGIKSVWSGMVNPARGSLDYYDADGKLLLHVQFRYDARKSDSVYIGELGINGSRTNYVHDIMSTTVTAEKVAAMNTVLSQVGLNPAGFANVLQVGTTVGGNGTSNALVAGQEYIR